MIQLYFNLKVDAPAGNTGSMVPSQQDTQAQFSEEEIR